MTVAFFLTLGVSIAIIAGVVINVLGWVVGTDYFLVSLPFFVFSILGWPIARVLTREQK